VGYRKRNGIFGKVGRGAKHKKAGFGKCPREFHRGGGKKTSRFPGQEKKGSSATESTGKNEKVEIPGVKAHGIVEGGTG